MTQMDPSASPKQMEVDMEMEDQKPSRKRKLCELIRIMGGSRKRKCTEKGAPSSF